jgi:hypothetical protein
MSRFRSLLGYTGATVVLLLAIATPLFLYNWFGSLIGAAGLKIHPVYSGGEAAFTVQREGYSVQVNQPVLKTMPLQRLTSFVQVTWTPVKGLPEHVAEELDIDRDGMADALVEFAVPREASGELAVTVTPRSDRVRALRAKGTQSMSALIVRVKDTIVVRLPVTANAG